MTTQTEWKIIEPNVAAVLTQCEFPLDELAAGTIPAIVLRNAHAATSCQKLIERLVDEGGQGAHSVEQAAVGRNAQDVGRGGVEGDLDRAQRSEGSAVAKREVRAAVRHHEPIAVVAKPPSFADIAVRLDDLEAVDVVDQRLVLLPRELNQPAVHQFQALGEELRREIDLPDHLARSRVDLHERRLAVEAGTLVELSVIEHEALGE